MSGHIPWQRAALLLSPAGLVLLPAGPLWWLGGLLAVVSSGLMLHHVASVSCRAGILFVRYPYRLRPKTCLLLLSEINSFAVRPGIMPQLVFGLGSQRVVLRVFGLGPAARNSLQTLLAVYGYRPL